MERQTHVSQSASSFVTDVFRRARHKQRPPILWAVSTPQPHRADVSDADTDRSLLIVFVVISFISGVFFIVQCVVYARYFIQRRRRASVHLQPVSGGVQAYGDGKAAAVVATSGRFSKTGLTGSGSGGAELRWQSEIFGRIRTRRMRTGAKMASSTSRRATSSAGRKSIFSISSASSSSNSTRRSPNYEMATPYPCTLTETITSQSERGDLSHRVSDASRATLSSRHTVRRSTSSLAGKSRLSLTLPPVLWAEEGDVAADLQHKENPGYDTESTSSHDKPMTTSSSSHKPTSSLTTTGKMTSRTNSDSSDSSREETPLDLPLSVISAGVSSGCDGNERMMNVHIHHPSVLDKNCNEVFAKTSTSSSSNDSSASSVPSSRVPSDSARRLGKMLDALRHYHSQSSSAEGRTEPSTSDNTASSLSRRHNHLTSTRLQAAGVVYSKHNATVLPASVDEHVKEVTSRWMYVSNGARQGTAPPGPEKRRRRRKKKTVIRQPKSGVRKAISLGGLWPDSLLPL